MRDYHREKQLRRRIYFTEKHLEYLLHVSTEPTTLEDELQRRRDIVDQLHRQIEEHENHIVALESTRDNVHGLIEATTNKLKSLHKAYNSYLIQHYLDEYMSTYRKLKKEQDANSQPTNGRKDRDHSGRRATYPGNGDADKDKRATTS